MDFELFCHVLPTRGLTSKSMKWIASKADSRQCMPIHVQRTSKKPSGLTIFQAQPSETSRRQAVAIAFISPIAFAKLLYPCDKSPSTLGNSKIAGKWIFTFISIHIPNNYILDLSIFQYYCSNDFNHKLLTIDVSINDITYHEVNDDGVVLCQ